MNISLSTECDLDAKSISLNKNTFFSINSKHICPSYISKDEYTKYNLDDHIATGLQYYLSHTKTHIDDVYSSWTNYRKLSNPFEYISTYVSHYGSNNIKFAGTVCSYKPISRAFFKLYEILYSNQYYTDTFALQPKINTFHIAEGPGGFIEAIDYMRKNKHDVYNGMTLINPNENASSEQKWDKLVNTGSIFRGKVNLVYGPTTNGNIYSKQNIEYLYEHFYDKHDIVTGDGGIDYTQNYNNQEIDSVNLIYAEIIIALITQKTGGMFVLKMFDTFNKVSIQLLYLLCICYNEVQIVKPKSSRPSNSERYVVCTDFKDITYRKDLIQMLLSNYQMLPYDSNINLRDSSISNDCEYVLNSIFDIKLPKLFIDRVEQSVIDHGTVQLNNLSQTLSYINENILNEHMIKVVRQRSINLSSCLQWCKKYNLPINPDIYKIIDKS